MHFPKFFLPDLDPCSYAWYRQMLRWRAPDLTSWLGAHPNVAAAIQWQYRREDLTNGYAPPTGASKLSWFQWSPDQKAELESAYRDTYAWLACRARQIPLDPDGLTDAPVNVANNVAVNANAARVQVLPEYMWKLYIAHAAFTLAAECYGAFPWRLGSFSPLALGYLLDSTKMAWRSANEYYTMGTYFVPPLRADNLPKTAFAPPTWTYPWLRAAGLIRATATETIWALLQWMRQNLWHFYGSDDFGTCDAVWQYRGYPPISRVIGGTIDANNPGEGRQHWTAGCHGSVGFLCAVLRAANIPVQPVWICGHELPWFINQNFYLSHGDDPYNANVRNSASSIELLPIDEATYQAWFTTDLAANITNAAAAGCTNVGRASAQFV